MTRFRLPELNLVLDADADRVWRGGRTLALSPLSQRLLVYLAHNRDRVVSKPELLREVWGARVSDEALRQALRQLRRELDASDADTPVVQTVRGRGYRLAARVEEEPVADAASGLPLIGRDTELAALGEELETTRAGHGRLVLLSGPAGIGKTRLLEELGTRAARRGFQAAVVRCADDEGAPPLWPWEQLLRNVAAGADAVLDALPAADREALVGAFPFLSDGAVGPAGHSYLEPGAARARLFEAVRRLLTARAGERPWVLGVDDAHLADATSRELLAWLAARLEGHRLLLLATYRDEELERRDDLRESVARWLRAPECRELRLGALSREDVARATRAVLPDAGPERVESVWRRCGGNPFYLRLALEDLRRGDSRSRGGEAELAPGVREAVLAHLAVLSPETRRVLETASALGQEVDPTLLAAVLGMPRAKVDAALAEATAFGLLRASGDARPGFAHALVSEALYGALAPEERPALHARVVEALEARGAAPPATVAEHAFRARAALGDEAVARRSERAAREAAGRLAFEEAARFLERALECTRAVPAEGRLPLLLELAEARARAGDVPRATEAAETAIALARRTGDGEAHARAVLAIGLARGAESDRPDLRWLRQLEDAAAASETPTPARARLLSRLAFTLYTYPDMERARELARRSLALAERVGDADALAECLVRAYRILQTGAGDDAVRGETSRRMQEVLPAVRDRLVAIEIALDLLAEAVIRGDPEGTVLWANRMQHEAEGIGGPHAAWWGLVAGFSLAHLRGRFEEAEARAEQALALGREIHHALATTNHALQLFMLRRDQGRLGEMEPLMGHIASQVNAVEWTIAWRQAQVAAGRPGPARELLRDLSEDGFARVARGLPYVNMLLHLAEMALDLDDRRAAALLRERILPVRERHAFVQVGFCHIGSMHHPLGRLEARLGDLDAAVGHLETGIARDRRMGAPACVARGQVALGRVLWERDRPGDRERARSLLEEGDSLARDLGMALRPE